MSGFATFGGIPCGIIASYFYNYTKGEVMRKTYLTALSLMLTAGALGTAPSASVAAEGQFYLAPGLQWMDFDKDRQLDDEVGFSLGLGYDFTDKVSGELH